MGGYGSGLIAVAADLCSKPTILASFSNSGFVGQVSVCLCSLVHHMGMGSVPQARHTVLHTCKVVPRPCVVAKSYNYYARLPYAQSAVCRCLRVDCRWFVMGPARSGSAPHVDPLATSAWNALLVGRKRWALLPPGTPRAAVTPRETGLEREAASWFAHVWPRMSLPAWPSARPLNAVQASPACCIPSQRQVWLKGCAVPETAVGLSLGRLHATLKRAMLNSVWLVCKWGGKETDKMLTCLSVMWPFPAGNQLTLRQGNKCGPYIPLVSSTQPELKARSCR